MEKPKWNSENFWACVLGAFVGVVLGLLIDAFGGIF